MGESLHEFADGFGRREPRGKLEVYVRGQLSTLPRKSAEPMALAAGIRPRSLPEFLASDDGDEDRLRERLQRLVAREHADVQSIGIIDESGHPKKGRETACVPRQYGGNTGKIDNCVRTVHLTDSRFDSRFHAMIDSDLYLPQAWHDDRARCRRVQIPDDVVYRPKYDIALEQSDRARAHGVSFAWITADEWYAQKPAFWSGLEERHQRYVLEIPRNFRAWLHDPTTGPPTPAKPVTNLLRYSKGLMTQPWRTYYIKDTDKGPMVWEVKAVPCWLPRKEGTVGPYWLVAARNILDRDEVKFFLSNAAPGTPLEVVLHVAFARWPVERCRQDEKTELGLSHFEVRSYPAVKRHLLITQASHLFLARQTERLRGEKSRSDFAAGPPRGRCVDRRPAPATRRSPEPTDQGRQHHSVPTTSQCRSPNQSHQNPIATLEKTRHPAHHNPPLPTRIKPQRAL